MNVQFDRTKALNALLYVANHVQRKDFHKIFKVVYFADRQHLADWGRPITGDTRLSKTNINRVKFLWFGKLLPQQGADMEANVARGLMKYFISPICKEAECAALIVEHKAFYLAVMKKDEAIAEPIAKNMASMEAYAAIADNLKAMMKEKNQ